eukprot:829582-Amphidinium_carterae.1
MPTLGAKRPGMWKNKHWRVSCVAALSRHSSALSSQPSQNAHHAEWLAISSHVGPAGTDPCSSGSPCSTSLLYLSAWQTSVPH